MSGEDSGIILPISAKKAICRDYADELCGVLYRMKPSVKAGIQLNSNVWVKNRRGSTLEIGIYKCGAVPVAVVANMITQWAGGKLTPQHLARIITQDCLRRVVLAAGDSQPAQRGKSKMDEESELRDDMRRQGYDPLKEIPVEKPDTAFLRA